MGRIRTKFIKRNADKLMRENLDTFTKNFDENKHKVTQFAEVPSKKIRNLLAGYITKKVKTAK
jgi:small subunit ribosomal protein S17e